jgi:hypothetical protein
MPLIRNNNECVCVVRADIDEQIRGCSRLEHVGVALNELGVGADDRKCEDPTMPQLITPSLCNLPPATLAAVFANWQEYSNHG